MTTPKRIHHDGQWITFAALSERTGISECCLRKRYEKGQRGDELVRASHRGRYRDEVSRDDPQVEALRAKQEVREAAERARTERKLARQRREQEARDRIAAEHAMAFARPLIDSKLVRPKERLAIVNRVRNCGQLNWRTDGGSLL